MRLNGEDRSIPTSAPSEAWRERLTAPNYRIGEAARYAKISASTVAKWCRDDALKLPVKEIGAALSYLQLIEVAVVAACRKSGMTMGAVREAHNYIGRSLNSDHPFATYRFKTDGKQLFLNFDQLEPNEGVGKLVNANQRGQLAWSEILSGCLQEFDYEGELAVRWRLAGAGSPIVIDPRIAFGAPNINGIPTWLFKERWAAGEPIEETADDFGLDVDGVSQALEFERADPTNAKASPRSNRHSSSIDASGKSSPT